MPSDKTYNPDYEKTIFTINRLKNLLVKEWERRKITMEVINSKKEKVSGKIERLRPKNYGNGPKDSDYLDHFGYLIQEN